MTKTSDAKIRLEVSCNQLVQTFECFQSPRRTIIRVALMGGSLFETVCSFPPDESPLFLSLYFFLYFNNINVQSASLRRGEEENYTVRSDSFHRNPE